MGKPVDMSYDFHSWGDVSYPGVAVAFLVIGVLYLIVSHTDEKNHHDTIPY